MQLESTLIRQENSFHTQSRTGNAIENHGGQFRTTSKVQVAEEAPKHTVHRTRNTLAVAQALLLLL